MIKYAKIIDKEKGICQVGTGDPTAVYKVELTFVDLNKVLKKTLYVKDFYISIGMQLLDVLQGIDGQWYLAGYAPSQKLLSLQLILKRYEDAVQAHLDTTAQSRGYDNTYTCLSYLFSTDATWSKLSKIFSMWRDNVWHKCHLILDAVKEGTLKQPTVKELIENLPVIDW